jgi:putative redox protein
MTSQDSFLKDALTATIAGIQEDARAGRVVFRADTCLEEGVRCSVKVRDFEPLVVDEPQGLGGTDAGMNPVELILGALGTCQQIMYAAYAAVLGVELTELSVRCKGHLDLHGLFGLDEEVPPGYTEIRFETRIESPESEEKILQLIETVESHCPVLDVLVRPIPVHGRALLNGEEIHRQEWARSPLPDGSFVS